MKLIKWILSKFGYVHTSDIPKLPSLSPVMERKKFEIKKLRCVIDIKELNLHIHCSLIQPSDDEKRKRIKKLALEQMSNDILDNFEIIAGSNGIVEFQLKVIAPTEKI